MATKFPKKKSSGAVQRGSKVRIMRKKSSGARTKQTARK